MITLNNDSVKAHNTTFNFKNTLPGFFTRKKIPFGANTGICRRPPRPIILQKKSEGTKSQLFNIFASKHRHVQVKTRTSWISRAGKNRGWWFYLRNPCNRWKKTRWTRTWLRRSGWCCCSCCCCCCCCCCCRVLFVACCLLSLACFLLFVLCASVVCFGVVLVVCWLCVVFRRSLFGVRCVWCLVFGVWRVLLVIVCCVLVVGCWISREWFFGEFRVLVSVVCLLFHVCFCYLSALFLWWCCACFGVVFVLVSVSVCLVCLLCRAFVLLLN